MQFQKKKFFKKLKFKSKVISYKTIPSTFDVVKYFKNEKYPVLILAYEQSNSVGTHDRHYVSKKNQGIYLTLRVNSNNLHQKLDYNNLTPKVGFILYKNLKKYFGNVFLIKWINDIYKKNGSKVAGILIRKDPYGISIGIGINFFDSIIDNEEKISGIISDKKMNKKYINFFLVSFINELLTYLNSINLEDKYIVSEINQVLINSKEETKNKTRNYLLNDDFLINKIN